MLKKPVYKINIILILILLLFSNVQAQIIGSKFFYKKVNNTFSTYEVFFSLTVPRDSSFKDSLSIYYYGDNLLKKDSILMCNRKEYVYKDTVTFAGNGEYKINYYDSSISRFSINSPNVNYYHTSIGIQVSSFFDNTSSPLFRNKGGLVCEKNQQIAFSPSICNQEGDSLHFKLNMIDTLPNYWIPDSIDINSKTGEIRWTLPDTTGKFEFQIEVEEYGDFPGPKGTAQNNFTIKVQDSVSRSGEFKEISGFKTNSQGFIERTLHPNEDLNLVLSYSDSLADSIQVEGVGGPFLQNPSPFFFTSYADSTTINASFSWTPDSSHV
ncbi:MAG: hypothetical protein ABEH43_00195, partial [Flavobacteriales bacterium]